MLVNDRDSRCKSPLAPRGKGRFVGMRNAFITRAKVTPEWADFLPHRLHAVCFHERIRDVSTRPAFCRNLGRGNIALKEEPFSRFISPLDCSTRGNGSSLPPRPLMFPRRDKTHQSDRTRSLTNTRSTRRPTASLRGSRTC